MLSQRDFLDAGVPLYVAAGIWLAFEFYVQEIRPEWSREMAKTLSIAPAKYYVTKSMTPRSWSAPKTSELFSAVSMQT